MAKRDLKLACRILATMADASLLGDNEKLRPEYFEGYDPEDVKYHFHILCEYGCFVLINTQWYDLPFDWAPLSWKGHDLLEQLKKEVPNWM